MQYRAEGGASAKEKPDQSEVRGGAKAKHASRAPSSVHTGMNRATGTGLGGEASEGRG